MTKFIAVSVHSTHSEKEYTDNRALLFVLDHFWYDQTLRRTDREHFRMATRRARKIEVLTARLRSQPVQRVIALTLRPDLSAQSECGRGGECLAIGVDVRDRNLDRSVVLGGDEAVYAKKSYQPSVPPS